MALKPQDVLVVLKLAIHEGEGWSYSWLASELGISASEAHAAVKRAVHGKLMCEGEGKPRPRVQALLEFLLHGLKYAFAPERSGITRGMPTAHAAPPISETIRSSDIPVVWPDPRGATRGEGLEPLYPSVVDAARKDSQLYRCLASLDSIRVGRARERKLAEEYLKKVLEADRAVHG